MPRPLRALALLTALLLGFVVAGLAAGPEVASAATRPVVTAVGAGAGPLTPTAVVVKGTGLSKVTSVKFGSKKAKILRRISATELQVRTPKGVRAGTVDVRVRTKAGWSKKSEADRYTFVAAPRLDTIAPSSGTYVGGQTVTLTGKNLPLTTDVFFGAARATVLSRSTSKVTVRSPIGVLGDAKVSVVTPGGTSKTLTFTYVRPTNQDAKTLDTVSDTFSPAHVEWVTGGFDADAGNLNPWVVGLPAGAASPSVGQAFVLAPGDAAFPAGLAGTVDDVAVQTDESVRVTVLPTDLDKSFDHLSVDYRGAIVRDSVAQRQRGGHTRETETAVEFPIDASSLFCHDDREQSVAVGADLRLRVTDADLSQHLDLGGFVARPTYDVSFTAEVELEGKFHVEGSSTCTIGAAWANAHRKIIPVGTSGATVSFAPAVELTFSAKGTVTIKNRSRTTFAVATELGKAPQFSRTSRTVEQSIGGAATFGVGLSAGVEVRFGLLDRAGVSGKVLLGADLALEATAATTAAPNVCITGTFVLKLSVDLFLDLFIARWDSPALTASIGLGQFLRTCVQAEQEPPSSTEPQIVSARLPDATISQSYSATLQTADNRAGSWSIVRYALPDGLGLDAGSGTISGVPTGPVGDQPVIIDFTDGQGKVATTIIRIRTLPATGIGGGDIQATLRWTGAADLDLHVVDPSGEEIYYGHPQSASGGTLDHDANAGCNGPEDDDNAVENVFWPPRSAPAGSYTAFVRVWSDCSAPLDWHLTVRRNGVVIIDQTGTADSDGYVFSVGPNAARSRGGKQAVTTVKVPVRTYPAK